MTSLLAKRTPPGGKPKTLVEHTVDVTQAAELLFGTRESSSRLGKAWLRFFRLGDADWLSFHSALLSACLFHDWGKANADMQKLLLGEGSEQLFRHEHLSVLLLGWDGVRKWIEPRNDIDWDVVLAAVGSHHLKFSDESFAANVENTAVRMFLEHEDVLNGLVGETARRLCLNGRPTFPSQPYWGFTEDAATFNPSELRDKLKGRLHRIKSSPLLNAVRSALIAADAIGSGLPRTGQDIESWLGERLDETSLCDKAAIDGIICKRVKDLTARGKWVEWNQFQLDCETLPERALLLAPCGAGKTLAAWRWILGQVRVRPVKRVLFLYPTRATATEGFKDYVSWAPETDASLLHGTAAYDLDEMFPPTDARAKTQFDNTDPRLFALRHWSKRVFSATVDQFFAFMSYSYGPMCLLPLLAESVIVVDEVHSFDKAMFSALLGFLKAFDVPVLCMTATMQSGRQDQLRPLMQKVYGYDQQPPDLAGLADKPRYRVKRIQYAEVDRRIRDAVKDGKRVLWVINQVSRAQEAVEKLADIGVPVICYHSRFKLDDRVERHRETIAAIRAGQAAAIVVSTQVCEMSLDIDADVLISEECPITSWIQRMGRCRRGRDELASKGPGEVYIYKPAKEEKVYSKEHLAGLNEFVALMESKQAVSQTDLESGLNRFGPKGADAPKLNSFLASGAYADAGEDTYRDIEAFNVQAVLDTETDGYLTAAKKDQAGFILPVPRKVRPTTDPRLPRWLHVADARNYDAKTGFHDEPIS